MIPSGQNYARRAQSRFSALCPLAQTPFGLGTPNLVQGCSVTRSFKIVKFRGVQKLGGSIFWIFDFAKITTWAGQNFRRGGRRDPNLQGTCTMVWHKCHVSGDPVGSKLCPQGTIPFFSLMPSSTETIGPRDTKFGTGVQGNKIFRNCEI